MSQPRLKVSVNVSLDDILCIAELFVTKPSMVRHYYKPESHVRKMGFCLQGQGYNHWISIHTIKYDYFYYMFWNADFWGATNLVWQCMWSVFSKRLLCCIQGQGHSEGYELQWMFARTISLIVKLSMVMHHHQPDWVLFRNIILRCWRSKPQSFLLDLQKYLNFCDPN